MEPPCLAIAQEFLIDAVAVSAFPVHAGFLWPNVGRTAYNLGLVAGFHGSLPAAHPPLFWPKWHR